MILAGDIGGTNSGWPSSPSVADVWRRSSRKRIASREHPRLEAIVKTFVSAHDLPIDVACFGIAGPVKNGRSETTNLPWGVDARELARALASQVCGLINDLEANAYGIAMWLRRILCPQSGCTGRLRERRGHRRRYRLGRGGSLLGWPAASPFACEGGHASFAPSEPLQIELLRFLSQEFGHVSWERVLSGPGLHNIYRFLRDTGRGEEPAWLTDKMQQHDPSAVISQAALADTSALCGQALDLFVSIYGAEAGNLALKLMATAGVYVGGGIAPKIIQKLTDSTFMQAFVAKGRLKPLLQAIPVRIIMNDKVALLGAARFATLQAS